MQSNILTSMLSSQVPFFASPCGHHLNLVPLFRKLSTATELLRDHKQPDAYKQSYPSGYGVRLEIKCDLYAQVCILLTEDLQHNVEVVKSEMVCKGYCNSWWKPQLARHLSKWGVEQSVLCASGL